MMKILDLFKGIEVPKEIFDVRINKNDSIKVYPNSVIKYEGVLFFIGKSEDSKFLYVLFQDKPAKFLDDFNGAIEKVENTHYLKKCVLNHLNAQAIQGIFRLLNLYR